MFSSAVGKQLNELGKMPKIRKDFNFSGDDILLNIFRKISASSTRFQVSVSNFKSRVSVSKLMFDKSTFEEIFPINSSLILVSIARCRFLF